MKYIIVKDEHDFESAILFPETLNHCDVARIHRVGRTTLVAAAFCDSDGNTYGESDSLERMYPRRDKDKDVIQKLLNPQIY